METSPAPEPQDTEKTVRLSLYLPEDIRKALRIRAIENAYAHDIITAKVKKYIDFRLDEGAANATVNRELAALSRVFSLALESALVTAKPHIPKLPENN